MSIFLQQLKWQFILLVRNNLIAISIFLTLSYTGLFWAIRNLGETELILTLLIYNDPAVIGLIFVGLVVIMEKDQSVYPAFLIAPSSLSTYLFARILPLSVLGWLCALGMGVAVMGTQFNVLSFSLGVFLTCLLFAMVGICLSAYARNFLPYMLRCIPLLLLMSLPLLNYFKVTNLAILNFWPLAGPLEMISNSYNQGSVSIPALGITLAWLLVFYAASIRILRSRIKSM